MPSYGMDLLRKPSWIVRSVRIDVADGPSRFEMLEFHVGVNLFERAFGGTVNVFRTRADLDGLLATDRPRVGVLVVRDLDVRQRIKILVRLWALVQARPGPQIDMHFIASIGGLEE